MDRDERRQRRLVKKVFRGGERPGLGRVGGRTRLPIPIDVDNATGNAAVNDLWKSANATVRLPEVQNVSENESENSDVAAVCEKGGNSSTKAPEHRSEVTTGTSSLQTWKKIAEDRFKKVEDLQFKLELQKLEVEEIKKGMTTRDELSEMKMLRIENQNLRDKYRMLVQTLERCLELRSSEVDVLTKLVQDGKRELLQRRPGLYQACMARQVAGKNIRNAHEAKVGTGSQSTVRHQANVHERVGCSGYKSSPEVNVNVNGNDIDKGSLQANGDSRIQAQHMGNNVLGREVHCQVPVATVGVCSQSKSDCEGKFKPVNPGMNAGDSSMDEDVDIGGQSSDENCSEGEERVRESMVKDAPNLSGSLSLEKDAADSPEALFTAAEYKSALAHVGQEFLAWLNKKTRRPTVTEMSFHKSRLIEGPPPPATVASGYFTWKGIPSTSLSKKFREETNELEPDSFSLTTLFRQILRVPGSKWGDDMLWCLVWSDSKNPEELPGYTILSPNLKRWRLLGSDQVDAGRVSKIKSS